MVSGSGKAFRGVLFLVFSAVIAVFLAPPAWAATGAMPGPKIAEINKPGTVMVISAWTSTIRAPEAALPDSSVNELVNYAKTLMLQNQIPRTKEAAVQAMLQELFSNPLKYLVPSNHIIEQDVQIAAMGSGFIITPDGYLVTNAHVVTMDDDELKKELAVQGLQQMIVKDLQDFQQQMDMQFSDQMKDQFVQAEVTYYSRVMQLDKVENKLVVEMGVAISGLPAIERGFPAEVVKVGQPSPGKDVAILKIEQKNLPTVTLGDDTSMRDLDPVYVMGYPGVATMHPFLSKESELTASTTAGHISARKKMPGGWDILQTDTAITHGNSGGPAFNDKGEVIGIATFGSVNESGQEVQGMNFLVPVSIVKEFLHQSNITPQQSPLSAKYEEGLTEFEKHHYKNALEKFREVQELNSGFPYVADYIAQSRTAIDQGLDQSFPMALVLGILGGVVLLVIILVVVIVVAKGKGKAAPVAVAAPAPMQRPVMPPPQPPMAQPQVPMAQPMAPPPQARAAAAAPPAGVTAAFNAPLAAPPQSDMGKTRVENLAEIMAAAQKLGYLQCIAGSRQGETFEITRDGHMIGRDPNKCTIVLTDTAVSKEHATIVPIEGKVFVIDRGSTNGTYIGSIDNPRITKVELKEGDELHVGKNAAVFVFRATPPTTT